MKHSVTAQKRQIPNYVGSTGGIVGLESAAIKRIGAAIQTIAQRRGETPPELQTEGKRDGIYTIDYNHNW